MTVHYDLCIIGGGIHGAGIARDAAGRGLRVLLAEKGDLAAATSSASTKLIHGGLRYLEHREFGLVKAALREREVLMTIAPHLVHPRIFVLPHDSTLRPYWMIAAGLFLYDRLAPRRRLPASQSMRLTGHKYGAPLKDEYFRGFTYSDCWTDDSRLVALNALDAAEKGADILTRTACTHLKAEQGRWEVTLHNHGNVTASVLVNAAGPWVRTLVESTGLETPDVPKIRLVKGSHIIVRQAVQGDHAYILQQPDKRIVFVLPYEDEFTLIGTTDVNFTGDPSQAKIFEPELDYLCNAFNRAFKNKISKADVMWTFSGVRSLFDDGSAEASVVTRDYHLHEHKNLPAPMISVFGGKLTTYRVLSEKVADMVTKIRKRPVAQWTAQLPLPGGDMPHGDLQLFITKKAAQYPFLPERLVRRYAYAYGTRMDRFLEGANSLTDLGRLFGADLYEAEVVYLIKYEFALTAEDVLFRRSKLGLHGGAEIFEALEKAMPDILTKVLQR